MITNQPFYKVHYVNHYNGIANYNSLVLIKIVKLKTTNLLIYLIRTDIKSINNIILQNNMTYHLTTK